MTSKRSQLIAFSKAVKAPTDKKKGFWAVLGTLDGVVLTGAPNLVYVTTFEGQTIAVINRRVPNLAGSVVFVGSDDYSANKIEVLYTLNVNGTNDGTSNQSNIIPPHDHSYGSLNVTWVYDAQFIPLLALPVSGTLTVQIYPGLIRKKNSDGWAYIDDQIVDLSADMPATGACWALLQANDDGTVDAVIGSTQADRASLTAADIPEATTGRAICAIVLEADYTELFRNSTRNDFIDMRFDKAGGGVSDAADVTYTPVDPNDWDYLEDPGDSGDALDQLADRTNSLETNQTDISSDEANITAVNFLEQGSDPAVPGANHRILYAKNDGMYERNSAGTVVGPLGTGSGAGGQYRQFVTIGDGAGGWEFVTFDGEPLMILQDLE